jgi:hypothetical protein
MKRACGRIGLILLVALPHCGYAQETSKPCPRVEIGSHVRQQFETYGPLSVEHEYFGFIYRKDGVVESEVVRSNKCSVTGACTIDTRIAAKRLPARAKVLGEWHTHAHNGSRSLSKLDVRGAYNNRRIACYTAYFASPTGDIYQWDPNETSVPTAMNSRRLVGSYREQPTAGLLATAAASE